MGALLGVEQCYTRTLVLENAIIAAGAIISKDVDEGEFGGEIMSKPKVEIIAEAGVNHNGDLSIALELIDAAANAGADYIKFQTFKAANLATKKAEKALYQKKSDISNETQYEMLSRLELSFEAHQVLLERCQEKKIGFLSSAFDFDSLDLLSRIDLPMIKIPSGEITNLPYLKYVGK